MGGREGGWRNSDMDGKRRACTCSKQRLERCHLHEIGYSAVRVLGKQFPFIRGRSGNLSHPRDASVHTTAVKGDWLHASVLFSKKPGINTQGRLRAIKTMRARIHVYTCICKTFTSSRISTTIITSHLDHYASYLPLFCL